ncbi:MAG: hypothetical protein IKC46_00835 [Lachnospiraceae bacterium]|nr:hypothetical protein [Lachnospiraceae bacterium]
MKWIQKIKPFLMVSMCINMRFLGNKSSYDVNITYPNGSSYWFHMSGGVGHGGWSDDYDEDRYVDGDTLSDVLLKKAPKEVNTGNWLAALIIIYE